MKVEGAYNFPAPPERVWALLMDPENLRSCIPGCEVLTETGPDRWDATLKVGVAAIRGTYKSTVAITEKEQPTSYSLRVEGSGGPGFVKGVAKITLAPEEGGTRVSVDGEGQVGGTVAGVGQRMLGGVARMLMNQFFECLKEKLTQPSAPQSAA